MTWGVHCALSCQGSGYWGYWKGSSQHFVGKKRFCILLSSLGAPPAVKTAAMQGAAVLLGEMRSFHKQGQGGSGHSLGEEGTAAERWECLSFKISKAAKPWLVLMAQLFWSLTCSCLESRIEPKSKNSSALLAWWQSWLSPRHPHSLLTPTSVMSSWWERRSQAKSWEHCPWQGLPPYSCENCHFYSYLRTVNRSIRKATNNDVFLDKLYFFHAVCERNSLFFFH